MKRSTEDATDAAESRRTVLATRVVFAIAGVAMSAWAPLVPVAQVRTGLDARTLGLVLLCFGAGSLVAMPLAGVAAARIGGRRVIVAAVVAASAALSLLSIVTGPGLLAATLFAFGAGLGALDVAMNLQAIIVERSGGRPMMSGFHALFSVGGIVGAAGVASALSAGVAPSLATGGVAAASLLAVVAVRRGLRSTATTRHEAQRSFAWPRGIVLAIGAMAATSFLVEGAVLDWSAIFLASARDVPVARAGAGYVAFSATMAFGRLFGDRVVARVGGRRTLIAGAALAAGGLAVVAVVRSPEACIAGFAIVGVGASNIVPVLFTQAGRQTTMSESLAVPAMTTMGYAGLLAGPAAIGFIAHGASLAAAFGLLALLMVLVGACAARAGR